MQGMITPAIMALSQVSELSYVLLCFV